MRRFVSIASAVLLVTALFAQPSPLQVRELTLKNGMTVWLNEDHTQPKVYGEVVVKAGAKDCPNTGIAHYFEHIMFKGTDRLGTVDYEAERPWLDSISHQYDLLSQTTDEGWRAAIQRHINELSLRAADYAIPNEFNRLISKYGGSGLNASTGPDMTCYYNTFLPQYISQWCHLNAHRLQHPVFRGFQGELENVYEEKNRGSDGLMSVLDKAMKAVFKDQPYGDPVIGSTENLKNPRLSDMEAFYRKYYVASNMGLILCGDITPDSTLVDLLEQTFGQVQTGPAPERTPSPIPPFAKGEQVQLKLPIPIIGAEGLVYSGPTAFHPDANAMRLARLLLSNGETGMIDSLVSSHAVMEAGLENASLNDAGVEILYVIPKIPFGKLKKAEALCLSQIERLMQGDFSEEQLERLKCQCSQDEEKEMETIGGRADMMVDAFSRGYTWQQKLQQVEALRQVTKADVIRVARKYFGANSLKLVKKYGTEKKETLRQPGYQPIAPRNADAKSAFARELEQLPVGEQPIRLVDFGCDVQRSVLSDHVTLYYKPNPVNDIFSFSIRYQDGSRHTPMLSLLGEYLPQVGTDSLGKLQLEAAWERIGVTMAVVPGDERFTFTISGRDEQLEPALRLLAHFLTSAKADNEALKEVRQSKRVADKAFGKQKDDVLAPMVSYLLYGQQSDYLRQPSLDEVKRLSTADLHRLLADLLTYDCELFYCGRMPSPSVATLSQQLLPLARCRQPKADTYRRPVVPTTPVVYFYHVPKSRQNLVGTCESLGPMATWKDRATAELWAQYMGGGMSSVLFQNIREFQSLAYSTFGALRQPNYMRHAEDALAYLTVTGTQADKTQRAMQAVDSLMQHTPMKQENLDAARQELLSDVQNGYPTFRTLGFYVANQLGEGYTADRNTEKVRLLPQLTASDVERFAREHVAANSRVWFVIGDRKQIDFQALQRFGRVVELKKDEIYK